MASPDSSTKDVEIVSGVPPSIGTSSDTTATVTNLGTHMKLPPNEVDRTEETVDSESSKKCTNNSGGEFQACTKIVKEMLEKREAGSDRGQLETDPNSIDDEPAAAVTDESKLVRKKKKKDVSQKTDESVKREENARGDDMNETTELVNTILRKKKQARSQPKKSKQAAEEEGKEEAGMEGELEKGGRPQKTVEGETHPRQSRRKNKDIARLPGSRLKICSHCGTVADKVKAKKCPNCKKFFFSHWAQRCKIPPCPNCHFSRKSRRFERFPTNCEKCGCKLPYDATTEQQSGGGGVDEGDGMESIESSSTSARITPDPSELDSFPGEWSEGKPDDFFDNLDNNEEVEMGEELEEKKPGKGKGRRKSRTEVAEISAEKPTTVQPSTPQGVGPDGTVMATTRSGRAYKQNTSPEQIFSGKKVPKSSLQVETATVSETGLKKEPFPQPSTTTSLKGQGSSAPEIASITGPKSPEQKTTIDTVDSNALQDTLSVDTTPVKVAEKSASETDIANQNTPLSTSVEVSKTSLPAEIEEVATTTTLPSVQLTEPSNTPLSSSAKEEVDKKVSKKCVSGHSLEPQIMEEVANSSRALSPATTPQHLSPGPQSVSPAPQPLSPDAPLQPWSPAHSPTPEVNPLSLPSPPPTEEPSTAAAPLAVESATPRQPPQSQPSSPEEQQNDRAQELEMTEQSSVEPTLFVDQEVQVAPFAALKDEQCPTIEKHGPTLSKELPSTPVAQSIDVVAVSRGEEKDNRVGGTASTPAVVGSDIAEQTQRETEDSGDSELLPKEADPVVSQPSDPPLTLSSGVQTERSVDKDDEKEGKGESDEGDKVEVFSNINRSLPFLRSVLSHVQGTVSEQDNSLGGLSGNFKDAATFTTTNVRSQGLPVLFTSNLGLEDKSQSAEQTSTVSSAWSSTLPSLASIKTQTTSVTEAPSTTTNTQVSEISVSIQTTTDSVAPHPCDDNMVVTQSGTLPSASTATLNTGAADPKTTEKPAPKSGKGKGAVGKDGKPLTSRKRKQPKTQQEKEETKQSKPRKPRTKKSKVMMATAPTITEEQSTAAISMLATSIAQELQRKPSLSSSLILGQHPKNSFSQYFYTEDGKLAPSMSLGSPAGPSGSALSEGAKTTSTKRSPSKMKESQEPPLKKKKLATIAPNNPLTSTASGAPGSTVGQLPLKIPQLCHQLASTLRMSSSGILSLLQTVLSTSNPSIPGISGGNIVSSAASGTACSSSSSPAPNPLIPNFFPPLTMSFQSLAAVLSNMPIATAPIRLSGTQVTARPLLPTTATSSATQPLSTTAVLPSTTLPLSLPTLFPSLGQPASLVGEQLLSQSETSVGTQTAVKMDTLKPLMPAISSSLSPQLLTLPNPPQLTASAMTLPPLAAPPSSLVPRDLKPLFQSVLMGQRPSPPPPPLTSTPELPLTSTSTSTAAVPLPVIQSNISSSSSYMALPVTSAPMFTSLPFLPTHTSILPFPTERTNAAPPLSGVDPGVQPLLISSLPEPSAVTATTVLSGLGSLLLPPPHLLPQPLYQPSSSYLLPHTLTSITPDPAGKLSSSSSSDSLLTATSRHITAPAPLIPSLLRPGISSGALPDVPVSSTALPPLGQQQVIYTQSITSPKVCPGLQPASTTTTTTVDTNLQVLVTNVQSRINEALSKSPPEAKPPELPPPLPTPLTSAAVFPPAPPPLTPAPPLAYVSKGGQSTSHAGYLVPHSQKKRGVVITRLAGPLSTAALSQTGEERSRHSSTSSLKSGDDPLVPVQSGKGSSDPPTVITLSPSPTASLEEGLTETPLVPPGSSRDKPQVLDQDSDKESDSYAKLMSEETLASDGSSEGEGPPGSQVNLMGGASGDLRHEQQLHQSQSGLPASDTDGRKREREKMEEREGWEGGARERDGDKGKPSKKRRKSSSGGSGKKTHMFSVKLKDCFLHHLTWMDYRMVLLVPLGEKDRQALSSQDSATTRLPPPPHTHDTPEGHGQEGRGATDRRSSSFGGEGGERRRRRKPVLKELSGYDMEEDDDDTSTSTTSSVHVPGPCFSVYELRNKLFQTLSPNAVYIYTYKNQIKSFKLPIHWVYILKRMGGMLESCHTCRLMDLEHVRGMCTHYGLSLPDTLDSLCRNELPKGRRVIDLSSIEPESLGPLHLEEIPPCSFTEKGRPYKPKSKKSKKKWRKDEEHRSKRKADILADLEARRSGKDHGGEGEMKESGGVGRKVPKVSTSSSVGGDRELVEGDEEGEGEEEGERDEEEEEGGGREGETGKWKKEWKEKHHKIGKRSPPPLIKRPLSPISSRTKKKPCPFCGAQVLKRSKKCSVCNKNFGVYTFGRKQCLYCGRVNLARMARCNECGQSLDNAPIARPKEDEVSYASSSLSHKKSDFIFGVRKRRKVHSVPLAFSGGFYSGYHHHHHQLASSSPSSSSTKMRRSSELHSPMDGGGRGTPGEVMSGEEEEMEEVKREEEEEEGGGEGAEDTQEEEVVPTNATSDGDTDNKTKTKSRMKSTSSITKHGGYQYGHIPWADADITVLVDEKGVAKFCLQELSAKVLVGHSKAEVFDMVRDLDLPLEQGNIQLLKKLQALGLHANRSPMCKLIASEELWLLLDALQELVPEEVHQHLENINTSTTPLLSPGSSFIRTAAVVATAPPTTNSAEEEEQTKSFESTLHEMQCSDGQYISVLRKWNGEQYACLPEMWRKYFPEVNRNHLSSTLRRLELETFMPTAQQATLLRSAQVISIRGAPGRLMKLEHMQALLDDFCIPLQLATGGTEERDPATKEKVQQTVKQQAVSSVSGACVTKPVGIRPVGRPRLHLPGTHLQSSLPPGKVLASKEDLEYADCMRNVLTSVDSSDLVAMLEKTRLASESQEESAYSHAAELDSQLDRLSQLIHTRRELSTVLSREMGFLNASVHGYMSEVVRLSHTEKQVLQNVDTLLSSLKISLL